MKKTLSAVAAVVAAAGMTLGVAAEAQASVGYTVKTCNAGRAGKFTVSSWLNDARTQKTYHFRAETTDWRATTVREVRWQGVEMAAGDSSLVQEGYRYSKYLGTTPWDADFQNYYLGVPTTTNRCGFSI